jgi:hypothetical protein
MARSGMGSLGQQLDARSSVAIVKVPGTVTDDLNSTQPHDVLIRVARRHLAV